MMGEKMSHYSVYKTQIGNLTATLLKDAITSLGKQIGMQVVSDIAGRVPSLVGLRSQALPSGIGFTLDQTGTLVVQGYSEYHRDEWSRVSTLAQNYIKAFKVAQTARNTVAAAKVNVKIMQKQVILEVVA